MKVRTSMDPLMLGVPSSMKGVVRMLAAATKFLRIATLVALAACKSMVLLGSECPNPGTPCGAADNEEKGGTEADPNAADAAAATTHGRDAGVGLGEAGFPPITNPSLEAASGAAGSRIISSTSDDVTGWSSCGAGAVSGTRGEFYPLGGSVGPTDGKYLVYAGVSTGAVDGVELSQSLSEALEPGAPYGFAVDLQTSGGSVDAISLYVFGSDSRCGHDELLSSSSVKNAGGGDWVTVCVTFVPASAHTFLVLAPRFDNAISSASTWYLDNLRPLRDGCP